MAPQIWIICKQLLARGHGHQPRQIRQLNWKTNSPSVTGLGGQGIQQITALAVSGSTLTGVGFAASSTGETPTIWRSPVRN